MGAGILWLGWTGFNGGDPFSANVDSSVAVLNTHICATTSILVWVSLDFAFSGKPTTVGAIQGMVTGLVCITPAAGLHLKSFFISKTNWPLLHIAAPIQLKFFFFFLGVCARAQFTFCQQALYKVGLLW